MAVFGPIQSPNPSVLFNPLAVDAQVQGMQRNRLLMQQAVEDRQVARMDREREEVGRVSASLLSLDPAARPAAYQAAVADLQRNGLARQAPAEYPGDGRIEQMARAAMPAQAQFALAEKQRASQEMNALLGGMLGGLGMGGNAAGGMTQGIAPPSAVAATAATAAPAGPRPSYAAGEEARSRLLDQPPEVLAQASAARTTVPEAPGGYRSNPGVAGQNAGLPPPTGTIHPNPAAAAPPGGMTDAQRAALVVAARMNPGSVPGMLAQFSAQNATVAERATDNRRDDQRLALAQEHERRKAALEFQASQARTEAEQRRAQIDLQRLENDRRQAAREDERFKLQNDPEHQGRLAAARRQADAQGASAKALEKVREAETEAARVTGVVDRFSQVFREQGGAGLNAFLNNPRDPKAQQLNQAFENLKMVMRSESLLNTGVLQPGEAKMLQDTLLAPTTMRGWMATPQGMDARLQEIKEMVNRGVAAQRASVAPAGGGQPQQGAPAAAAPQRLRFNPATGRIE